MANGIISNRIDASTMSENVDGKRRITGIQLSVPFGYTSGTSTCGTHYEMSLDDARMLLDEIQKTLDLASAVNNGESDEIQNVLDKQAKGDSNTSIPFPSMLLDAKGDPERQKQMRDALDAINQKHGNKE